MWDFDMVQEEEAIVHCIVPELRANVTNMHILQRLVSLQISDLHNKGMWAKLLPIDNQLRHHNSMICSFSEGSDPPFRGSQMGRMECEGLFILIPRRCRFQTSNI